MAVRFSEPGRRPDKYVAAQLPRRRSEVAGRAKIIAALAVADVAGLAAVLNARVDAR